MFSAMQERNREPLAKPIRRRVAENLEKRTWEIQRALRGENIGTPNGNGVSQEGKLYGPNLDGIT